MPSQTRAHPASRRRRSASADITLVSESKPSASQRRRLTSQTRNVISIVDEDKDTTAARAALFREPHLKAAHILGQNVCRRLLRKLTMDEA